MPDGGDSGAEGGDGSAPGMEISDWVRRLYGNSGLHIPDGRLAWNAVHIEQFLRWCRGCGEAEAAGRLGELARLDLKELELTVASSYRRDQARQALAVFYRGVDDWHLSPGENGGWEPKFRLKTGVGGEMTLEEGVSEKLSSAMAAH